jgi:hypothetical protein
MITARTTLMTLAAAAALAVGLTTFAPAAGATTPECLIVTFTEPAPAGQPQILHSRTAAPGCEGLAAYDAMVAAAEQTAAETCAGIPIQGDLVDNAPPWSTSPLGEDFPVDVPGAHSAITTLVGTKDCSVPEAPPVTAPTPEADSPVSVPEVTSPAPVPEDVGVSAAEASSQAVTATPVALTPAPPAAAISQRTSLPQTGGNAGPLALGLSLLAAGGAALVAGTISHRRTVQ